VGLSAVVLADGSVGEVKVTQSLDTVHGLDEEAVRAVRLWRFAPGTKAGTPVDVRVNLLMRFTLK
jgi:protein TonB